MKAYLNHPLIAPGLLLAATVLVLATVFVFEYGFGILPCHLCHIERIPYYGGGAALLVILALHAGAGRATPISRLLLALVGIGFLVGAGIALYHVGVEQKWWEGPASCTGSISSGSLDDAVDRLLNAPLIRCDQVAWSLFGISMAGYNIPTSLVLGGFALYLARTLGGNGRQEQ